MPNCPKKPKRLAPTCIERAAVRPARAAGERRGIGGDVERAGRVGRQAGRSAGESGLDRPVRPLLARRASQHHHRADALDPARRPRPDHRRGRVAAHGAGPRRLLADRVGGVGLPGRVDRRHADLRQARRPVRPTHVAVGRDRRVPDRIGRLRVRADDAAADRRARAAGPGRRRADLDLADHHRRRRAAARARSLPGLHQRRVRGGERRRAGGRRPADALPDVALDLLDQPAARGRSASSCRGAR